MNFKTWLCRFFATTLLLFAAGMPSLAADHALTRDDYAVYSAVLANILLSDADRGEALAIAGEIEASSPVGDF